MRILLIKTASLGGVFQLMPALNDAQRARPDVVFDWVVEECFSEVPAWHSAVDKVIPVCFRRWRKHPLATIRSPEWRQFKNTLSRQHYDLVIDCQGMLKSAVIARLAKAPIAGLDKNSVREPMAAWFYHHRYSVDSRAHKVERMRGLFAQALSYEKPSELGDYGIDTKRFKSCVEEPPNVVLLHSSIQADTLYPENYWRTLAEKLVSEGYKVRLPWGIEVEHERARRIANDLPGVEVMPKLNLHGLACLLIQSDAVVAMESGLSHLCAAIGVPMLSLHSKPSLGKGCTYGVNQYHVMAKPMLEKNLSDASSVFGSLLPESVLDALHQHILPADAASEKELLQQTV